ncbi:MAG: aminoacyl-tRNA hydrolase [Pseudomonadota bacterium]
MEHPGISLIVGLGNPGSQHANTRHNVGFWFLASLQTRFSFTLSADKKAKAEVGSFSCGNRNVRVAAPQTYMNLSGQSVAPLAKFYRIPPEQILVIHDELDMAPGVARIKIGGGLGGHNGLKDITARLGSRDFARLRIGIGHPGHAGAVSGYVLKPPPAEQKSLILDSLDRADAVIESVILGDMAGAMLALHTVEK